MIIITGYIFYFMLILGFISAIFAGRIPDISSAVISSGEKTISLMISMSGIICLWSGILKIAEKAGITLYISKLLAPITKRLFKGANEKAMGAIVMNISANLLGLSNAATPMGIMAMRELAKDTNKTKRAMVNFCLVNTVGFQVIPTTVASLRASAGSREPFSIMPLSILVSIISLIWVITASGVYFKITERSL